MQRIFISHARENSTVAERLCVDLRNVGHDVSIDTEQLKIGGNLIEYMNSGLSRPVLILLHSAATPNSVWQKRELEAATWLDISSPEVKVFVLKLDSTPVPPLLQPKIFGEVTDTTYSHVLRKLCEAILPCNTANSIVSQAFREDSPNPFWRIRAEYFEQAPEQLAAAFSQPAADKIGILEDVRPSFIEGSRGTGKTMLLMSLRARHLYGRRDSRKRIQDLFGFYLRLTRGAFCNSGLLVAGEAHPAGVAGSQLAQITETFSQEFFLQVIESLFSELSDSVSTGAISCPESAQAAIVKEVSELLGEKIVRSNGNFETLLNDAASLHRVIAIYTKRRFIYGESARAPVASLDLDVLKLLLKSVRRHVPELAKAQFVLLLDEYENLFHHQKLVVNDIVKLGAPELSVKIAKKVGTAETSETLSGQELQEIHDYSRIGLVYSVEENVGEFQRYKELLERIVKKTLANAGSNVSSLDEMLPDFDEPQFTSKQVSDEVEKLLGTETWSSLTPAERSAKCAYYGETALYRLAGASGGGRHKAFAGFSNLAFMSSGVIRYFQEIVGLAFYLQRNEGSPVSSTLAISPKFQSRAVHLVSEHNLSALSRNVEKHGEQLKYLLLDLGDALRWKLLKHSSEPEAGRLALIDADALSEPANRLVQEILTLGVREGVFQLVDGRPGMRPKHPGDPQPVEFNISRVFCPVLKFSPRLRWKTTVSCKDLAGLLTPRARASTKTGMLERIVKIPDHTTAQSELGFKR